MQEDTTLVMLESPTNPRMQICDIAALCAVAHQARLSVWAGSQAWCGSAQRLQDLQSSRLLASDLFTGSYLAGQQVLSGQA